MMKKKTFTLKKAFTLIELLAVIIILGVLTVLIVPKVVTMLSEAEKNTNMTSVQNLVKAAGYKAANNEITGNTANIKINYTTGENTNYIDYSGEKPTSGRIDIRSNGKVAMAVQFGDYCYIKTYNSDEITTIEYNDNTCGENAEIFINYELPQLVTSGDGLYESTTDEDRYIYRGSNPNNYIWLDENGDEEETSEELYRIISYEPDGTIKVVRDDEILEKEWDERISRSLSNENTYCAIPFGCNVWGSGSNTLYNGVSLGDNFHYSYYTSSTATSLTQGTSGTVTLDSTLNTYLNDTWLNGTELSNYIANHSFNVGGVYYYDAYTGGDKGLTKEQQEEQTYTWNGKIGLLNITEYVETSNNSACTSVYSNYQYNPDNNINRTSNEWPCKYENYNYKSEYSQWFISPNGYLPFDVWGVSLLGWFVEGSADSTLGVRPAFYLRSSVILDGEGTSEEPYYIIP